MRFNYRRTLLIGMAFLGISALWQVYDVVIPLILEQTFSLNKTFTGVIMSLDNILALFLLPFFGAWSDRCRSPLGKRKPFIFVGTLLAATGLYLIPWATNLKNFWIFNVGLGIVLLATAIYRAPAIALMPDLTPKPLRSKANAIINLQGAIGAMLALVFIALLSNKFGYLGVFAAISSLMLLSLAILWFRIDEQKMALTEVEDLNHKTDHISQKLSPGQRSSLLFLLLAIILWFMAYNGITTAFSRYALSVWQMNEQQIALSLMVATLSAIISYLPSGFFASKFGRKKAILLGLSLMSSAYLLGILLSTFSLLTYLSFSLMGMGWAFINVNSLPMLVDICQASDIGKFTGMYYTASMTGQIITPILSGFLMENLGFPILFPYALVFSLLALLTLLFVKHGDSRFEATMSLEAFDVEG